MMMRTVAIALLSLTAAACAIPQFAIDSEQAPGADLAHFRTYQWLPDDGTGAPRVLETIVPAVNRQLHTKGYDLASGEPDFQVGAQMVVESRIEYSAVDLSIPGTPGYRMMGGPMSPQTFNTRRVHSDGTLIITVVDPRSRTEVWRGWAEAQVNLLPDADQRAARIAQAVEQILARFPSRQ